jgi:two-component system sensor histidine kinase TctE
LVIWDEGPGIDSDLKDRLFQPFVASAGGTGLGLSICLQIAQAMKAEVRIFNRVKDGKTVGVDAVISWG